MRHILILGGTTEASALAAALAARGDRALLSYAGRVDSPKPQPVPVRMGGFGGAAGLTDFITANRITHVVDATHPFAATMSANAVAGTQGAGVPLLAFTRPAWVAGPGDDWARVPDIPSAAAALAGPPQRVMLAIGRMHLEGFTGQPQHHYILRLVDPPAEPLPLPRHSLVIDRGPFGLDADLALLRAHRVQRIVCKNAGGAGARAKLDAARMLGLPVVMIDRPALPPRDEAADLAAVLDWLGHGSTARGV